MDADQQVGRARQHAAVELRHALRSVIAHATRLKKRLDAAAPAPLTQDERQLVGELLSTANDVGLWAGSLTALDDLSVAEGASAGKDDGKR
ncbi:hypothetical protein ACIBKY_51045 [Nonomuraea sp. NPDC050394]|uniref:hypothetical protein n=1 Tax=Nonomuraea sp. NPDC050394 TaxID=3364363 RepID=UPI0037B9F10C